MADPSAQPDPHHRPYATHCLSEALRFSCPPKGPPPLSIPIRAPGVFSVTESLYDAGMAQMWRFTFVWSGFTGAPGYTNLFFDHAGSVGDISIALNTFWEGMRPYLSTATTVQFLEGAVVEATTGELVDAVSLEGLGSYVGQAGAESAAPAGVCITWRTGAIVNGRRLRGRTFIVPIAANGYQANGTPAYPDQIETKANDLITDSGGSLVVWHRPVGGVGGSFAPVTDASVKDHVAVLRSRGK